MCTEEKTHRRINPNIILALSVCLGFGLGYLNLPMTNHLASAISDIFINLLKLVSLPMIFLSIVSTASGMKSISEIKYLGKKIITYTLLTTILAASIALALFVAIDPVQASISADSMAFEGEQGSYWTYLMQGIPSNVLRPFVENQVVGVLFLAILMSFAILSLPEDNKKVLHSFFSSFYAALMVITKWVVRLMPIAIFSFITLFVRDLREGLEVKTLFLYLTCVVCANLIQGFIVLPGLLAFKKVSPIKLFKAMLPALSVAFFTKSSGAALPMAMKCAEENAQIPQKVSRFAFPLCTTINMNGCAAFILITVLFVSMSNGMIYSPVEMVLWIFIATIAAVGNAGVPMGCYFLSSAFLAAMGVPLNLLGIILPVYAFIDMLETAINVWSDSCVAAVVHKEVQTDVRVQKTHEATLPTTA